jgi:hypothetical protein
MQAHLPGGCVRRHAGKRLCFLLRETQSIATRGPSGHPRDLVVHLFGPPAVCRIRVWGSMGLGVLRMPGQARPSSISQSSRTRREKEKRTSTSSVSSSSGPPSPSSSSLSPVAFEPSPPWTGARSARFVGTGPGSGCSGRTLSFPVTFVERRGFVSSGLVVPDMLSCGQLQPGPNLYPFLVGPVRSGPFLRRYV